MLQRRRKALLKNPVEHAALLCALSLNRFGWSLEEAGAQIAVVLGYPAYDHQLHEIAGTVPGNQCDPGPASTCRACQRQAQVYHEWQWAVAVGAHLLLSLVEEVSGVPHEAFYPRCEQFCQEIRQATSTEATTLLWQALKADLALFEQFVNLMASSSAE